MGGWGLQGHTLDEYMLTTDERESSLIALSIGYGREVGAL